MYREVVRMPGVNVTVQELNDYIKKTFGVSGYFDPDYELFDIKPSDLAINYGGGFIKEVDGETVIYTEEHK